MFTRIKQTIMKIDTWFQDRADKIWDDNHAKMRKYKEQIRIIKQAIKK